MEKPIVWESVDYSKPKTYPRYLKYFLNKIGFMWSYLDYVEMRKYKYMWE